jgi:anti-anti-sigma regulatory factor
VNGNTPRAHTDFTEVVDQRRGSVRASGHLTAQAADLLRGTVLALRGDGHPRVVVDLGDVADAEDGALATLEAVRTALARDGGRLLVVGGPAERER